MLKLFLREVFAQGETGNSGGGNSKPKKRQGGLNANNSSKRANSPGRKRNSSGKSGRRIGGVTGSNRGTSSNKATGNGRRGGL